MSKEEKKQISTLEIPTEKKHFSTLELQLAAFLEASNIEVKLEELSKGRHVFVAEASDKLYKLLNDYNSNSLIGITDYVAALKKLKNRLYAAKAGK